MSAIAGFYNPHNHYLKEKNHYEEVLSRMAGKPQPQGPEEHGLCLLDHGGLSISPLSATDGSGLQPMTRAGGGQTFAIACNGEIYNAGELRQELMGLGRSFRTSSDAEVLLEGYMEFGPDFVNKANGIFAFAILDSARNRLCLFRDRAGAKSLFYMIRGDEILFSSQPKGILACPGIKPRLDKKGLNELFSLGPARTPGSGVFKDMYEVLPGHYLLCSPKEQRLQSYWKLESRPHEDSYEKTIATTSFLVQDAVKMQMASHVPVCAFLSGGLDSSLVSALCADQLKKQGKQLTTFSFDFVDNDKYFKANSFQPALDRPFVDRMVQFLDSDHHYLSCDSLTQADRLYDSVLAHDLPAMGDIDSSLLQFCSLVSEHSRVALTGECADEIFGGYPWFHKKECFEADTFPWTMDLNARKVVLDDGFLEYLDMDAYVKEAYSRSVAETPVLAEDTPLEARRREIAYLNLRWFMQTLLNRMDRTGTFSGLEARAPFADHRIMEYLWNVPWDMKTRDGVVKNLLRQSAKGLLPEDILFRRKSPYPKTYDTSYEKLLAGRVREIMGDGSAPVMRFLDREKLDLFLSHPGDYARPWYGQLMAGPQMMAYILQINFWLDAYNIEIVE